MKTLLILLLPWLCLGQIGAKTSSAGSLQGNWVNTDFGFDMKLDLLAGGKGSFDEESITYSVSGNKLTIKTPDGGETYTFTLSGNSLTLSGGDLDSSVTFKKGGATSQVGETSGDAKLDKLLGQWTTEGADLDFKPGGKGTYNGKAFSYSLNGNTLTTRDETGENQFVVIFLGKAMTLMGQGINATFNRGHTGYKMDASPNQTAGSTGGNIDQSIAGKWCYVSSLTNTNASSSYSRCLNINAKGTYTYQAEGSISGYGGGYYGGSSSQNADSGTWRLDGNRIYVNSRSEGNKVYSFEKRNHPKTREPMIIIDGDAYVTYYQRNPW